MTHSDTNTNAGPPESASDRLERLISLAGPRPEPSSAVTAEVREAVFAQWQRQVGRRSRVRRVRLFALAATLVAGLGLAIRLALPPDPMTGMGIASIERIAGTATMLTPEAADWHAVSAATGELAAGTRIRTAAGSRLALVIGKRSLRLDYATEIELVANNHVALSQGRVYIDSNVPDDDNSGVSVTTPLTTVVEIGTQFEVLHDGQETRVRVREGRVTLETDNTDTGSIAEAIAGEQISLAASGVFGRSKVDPGSPEWNWAQAIAPDFRLDGALLAEFLAWISRETGREIEFADPATRQAAEATILRGSIDGLLPGDALAAVLATTRFDYETTGNAIRIYVGEQN